MSLEDMECYGLALYVVPLSVVLLRMEMEKGEEVGE